MMVAQFISRRPRLGEDMLGEDMLGEGMLGEDMGDTRRERVRRRRVPMRGCRSEKRAKSTASIVPVQAGCHPAPAPSQRRSSAEGRIPVRRWLTVLSGLMGKLFERLNRFAGAITSTLGYSLPYSYSGAPVIGRDRGQTP